MAPVLFGIGLCGGSSLCLSRNLNLFLGVDVAESVVTSARGGGGGNVKDLVLMAPEADAGGGSGGPLLRSSSSSRVGTPSVDESLTSL